MKKRIYYCTNCETEQLLPVGRHWCHCYSPPFEMMPHTKEEDKAMSTRINSLFSGIEPIASGGNVKITKKI